MSITRQFLVDRLESQFGLDAAELSDQTPLFSTGMLDSFSVAELLVFLEEKGNFRVEATEVTLDNLDSIARILAFSQSKTASPDGE
jgi:acyl carrier protein